MDIPIKAIFIIYLKILRLSTFLKKKLIKVLYGYVKCLWVGRYSKYIISKCILSNIGQGHNFYCGNISTKVYCYIVLKPYSFYLHNKIYFNFTFTLFTTMAVVIFIITLETKLSIT